MALVRRVPVVDIAIGVVLGLVISVALVLLGMHQARPRYSHWGMNG